MAYSSMHIFRRTPITSPGLAPRGQYTVQSLHWWHSQISGLLTTSFSPHWAWSISFRGKGFSPGVRLHTTEQVSH